MSMHNKPLTVLEAAGLEAHHLPMGTPSQLADAFRHGMAWALSNTSPLPSEARTMGPLKLVALLSGGDWSDANVTLLKVPAAMVIAEQKAKYEEWYKGEYVKTLGTPFQVSFMGFQTWLLNNGAVEATEEDVETFEED